MLPIAYWGHLLFFVAFCSSGTVFASTFGHSKHAHLHHNHHPSAGDSLSSDEGFSSLPLLFSRDAPKGQSGGSVAGASTTDFTCGPKKKCSNNACCGKDGWCGYGDTYCGTGCQSNCDAKAECGKNAATPGQTCPLNVCCSQFGFCGTTTEFCSAGCQSNCKQPKPSVQKTSTQQRIIGYYETWSDTHACGTMEPEEIPVEELSHLIAAFAYPRPDDYVIQPMPGDSYDKFQRIVNLKQKNGGIKIMIALGGWSYTDPGTYSTVFSDIVSTKAKRAAFIKQLLKFLSTFGFDGVDFDWEYPGAEDRGGNDNDGVNYTKLLEELQAAIASSGYEYIVTFTAPTSYWYLRHFDIAAMTQHVDWINLMSYDLHGVWDRDDPIGSQVLAHTNTTEIDLALDLFWRNEIDPNMIVLGLGFYGRSFKLTNSNCWKPGCQFSEAGDAGPCTGQAGILSYKEIQDILASTKARPFYDDDAKVNYMVYGDNNWISFDGAKSIQAKIDFANDRGLSGLMIWAVDLDDSKHSALSAVTGDTILDGPLQHVEDDSSEIAHSTDDLSKCTISECGKPCGPGYTAVGRTASYFGKKYCSTATPSTARYICCPSFASPDPSDCAWHDQRAKGGFQSDCAGKCNVGDIEIISGDSFGWIGGVKDGHYGDQCGRGGKVFCCKAGNMQQYLDICSWTECGGTCPSNKPNVLTTDGGGPLSQGGPRCGKKRRSLCCPSPNSFKNCSWNKKKVCSESCSNDQITLDTDPQGSGGGRYCDNGREQVFCCDPPGGTDQPFTPFDLKNLFPSEYLPPPDAIPTYDLVSFGGATGSGDTDPNNSGVAFFLMAGSTTAVTSMRKRDAPGLLFLDCPHDVLSTDVEQHQVARVVCLSNNLDDCFGVRKGGVNGTVVQMPETCASGTFSRAISLELSQDQHIPEDIDGQSPASPVYDFVFDYNTKLVRRDAGRISIRMDYSNLPGYWDTVVNSPVSRKRSSESLVERFFSSTSAGWAQKMDTLQVDSSQAVPVNEDLQQVVFFESQTCTTESGTVGEGVGIGMEGTTKADLYFGFSLVATWDPSSTVQIHEAGGFIRAEGSTDVTIKIGGTGIIDSSKKLQGEGIIRSFGKRGLRGHSIYHGWASFDPYMERGLYLHTYGTEVSDGGPSFDGYMEARAVADFGKVFINYPGPSNSVPTGDGEGKIKDVVVSKGNNFLRAPGDSSQDGSIFVQTSMELGLQVTLAMQKPYQFSVPDPLPEMSIRQGVGVLFELSTKDDSHSCLDTSISTQMETTVSNTKAVGWGDEYDKLYFSTSDKVGSQECFSEQAISRDLTAIESEGLSTAEEDDESNESNAHARRKKRANGSYPQDPNMNGKLPSIGDLLGDSSYNKLRPQINCRDCNSCGLSIRLNDCCGCAWLRPEQDYLGAIPLDGDWEFASIYRRDSENVADLSEYFSDIDERAPTNTITMSRKDVDFGAGHVVESEPYPAYPDYYRNPNTDKDFDTDPKASGVKKYFHNATTSCTDFDVAQFTTYDTFYKDASGTAYHSFYQTEHVFEGQTVGRFFTEWLANKASPMRSQAWIAQYIVGSYPQKWTGGNFANTLVDALGSRDHPDRLTVFLDRPNGHKGRLFKGSLAVDVNSFGNKAAGDEQLLVAREIGMIFTYMNVDTVWESFCDTYNDMLDLFGQFDTWHNTVVNPNGVTSKLADEFPKHVRAELDMVVETARKNLRYLNQWRAYAGPAYKARWFLVMQVQLRKVKLARTDYCRNLPKTTQ